MTEKSPWSSWDIKINFIANQRKRKEKGIKLLPAADRAREPPARVQ